MTITRAELFTVRFSFSPRRGPSVAWGSQHAYALLRLEDSDGAVGWGETYLVTGAVAALEAAWPVLRGRRAGDAAVILAAGRWASEHAYASSAVASGAGIARYSGESQVTPMDPAASTATGTAALTGSLPGVVTSAPAAMLVGCMALNTANVSIALTAPPSMTIAWDLGGKRHAMADELVPAAGPSGSRTWTFGALREWAGWMTALRPAPG